MPKTADDVYDEWASRLKGSIEKMKKGVDDLTESPTKSAADKIDKMFAGFQAAYNDGRIKDGLLGIDLSTWQELYKAKLTTNLGSGVDGAKTKMTEFLKWLLPKVESISKTIKAMPSDTYEQRKARAVKMMDSMHDLPYKGKKRP